ncbi:hypothetical protein EZV62_013459 [Acer yangbiense]|uniref:Uncharacterized protein n=1 Tax=Acer yangbiense TaxID=1000413 RepID=A0A5C7I065_9ROSI|nr:hypothetical protein EZV62_013459 [Acer yangbiense]
MGRKTNLRNKTNRNLDLIESSRFSGPSSPSLKIRVESLGQEDIGATKFHNRAKESFRPAVIKIFLDGVDTKKALTPKDFMDYSRISFSVVQGELIVTGIKASLTDQLISSIWFFRFVSRGDYRGRVEERIV